MGFDWRYLVEVLPTLLAATLVTVRLAVLSFLVALLLGLPFALAETSRLRHVARLVGEFLRLTPLLVQLFFAFYVLPEVGVALSAEATGVLVLGLHYGIYVAQVYLAGIRSVPKGQWEAARSLALPPLLLWGVVILPQAVRPMVPALGNYLIQLFKEVPILSTITVFELLNTANLLAGQSFRYLELLSFVGLVFLVLSYASSLVVRRLEAPRERIG